MVTKPVVLGAVISL